jgi:hypothetical protein|tara:strand:+ start:438 stop:656 length:219 start_codon:yes stop_codon:yes gene_type:complete
MFIDAYLHIFENKVVKLEKKLKEMESSPSLDLFLAKQYRDEIDKLSTTIKKVKEGVKAQNEETATEENEKVA